MGALTKTAKIDVINIGLLIVSCIAAFILPFELFLFVYAVLGPLHYLTEISWLHDKNYYATGKYDVLLLVGLSLILTVFFFLQTSDGGQAWIQDTFGFDQFRVINNHLIFVGFASALFFAFIKNPLLKVLGIFFAIIGTVVSSKLILLFSVFLPTLIHVFIFTSIFMLYGALKSRSKTGYLTVALHLICPFLLFYLIPGVSPMDITNYGKEAYSEGFASLNHTILQMEYFQTTGYQDLAARLGKTQEQLTWNDIIYSSKTGIAIMRFIAFAYTYHYLNWFSKTEIIRWHKVPKVRFIFVIVGFVASVVLYAVDYALGFKWLFLLSFMHVMLEFPLNYISFVGVFKEIFGSKAKLAK